MTQLIQDPVYYYDEQIRDYILQFMAVFAGIRVRVGKLDDREPSLIPVHLTYGAKDRVVASILGDNTQNKPIRLPAMSAYMNGIELAPDKRKGVGARRREVYMPTGGQFPTDIRTIEQLMPVPYNTSFELSIYTSNRDEHFQILEQIMMFFDPILQVQKNDDTFDWTKITTVELLGINFEENYPAGTDRRIIQTTCQFVVPVYIGVPAKIKNDWIADIYMRLGVASNSSFSGGSYDVVAELDDLGFDYQKVFDLSEDFDLPEGPVESAPEPNDQPDTIITGPGIPGTEASPLVPPPPGGPGGSPLTPPPLGSPLPVAGSPLTPAPGGGSRNVLNLDNFILTQGLQ
jgi:hypothetical protein